MIATRLSQIDDHRTTISQNENNTVFEKIRIE